MNEKFGYTIEDVIQAGKEKLSQFDFDLYEPDFLGLVTLDEDARDWPITSGVRPAHQVTEDILTSGEHIYFEDDILMPGKSARAYIRLLTPVEYPNCLWVGKELNLNEGSKVIGAVRVLEIYNEILLRN